MAQFNPFEAKQLIETQGGKFFRVLFKRKNDKVVGGVVVAKAGETRSMLCRRGVKKFVKGVIPPAVRRAEDSRNMVLTVHDVEVFRELRTTPILCPTCNGAGCAFCKQIGKRPMRLKEAGAAAYRRINLQEVEDLSFLHDIKVTVVAGVVVSATPRVRKARATS